MIIPVRCVTCNKVLGDKWLIYQRELQTREKKIPNIISIQTDVLKQKTNELEIFESIGVTRYCCKRHLLSHIDLMDKI